MSSTEQTENARALLDTITKHVAIAVENNKAHATVTTNAWKDSIFAVEKASQSLALLLFQINGFSQTDAGAVATRASAVTTLNAAADTLANMSLVFHTDTRWKMLKKAREALRECQKTVGAVGASEGKDNPAQYKLGQRDGTASSTTHSGMSNRDILNAPMPVIQKGVIDFNPSGGNDLKKNEDGTFEKPYMGKNIKPTNMLTFSSAESSASARLGVSGKCATCGAARDASSKFCTACGKASNIVFS